MMNKALVKKFKNVCDEAIIQSNYIENQGCIFAVNYDPLNDEFLLDDWVDRSTCAAYVNGEKVCL